MKTYTKIIPAIAVALLAAPLANTAHAAFLSVDFDQSGTVATQAGFESFAFNDASSHTLSYARAENNGDDGTVDVTLSGQTHYRNYNPITSGAFLGMTNLLHSSALIINSSGAAGTGPTGTPMTISLGDLAAGTYEITTYHHNTQFGAATLMLYLTDSIVTANTGTGEGLQFTGINSVGETPTSISTVTTTFVADGTNDVLIDMYSVTPESGGGQMKLNGFELSAVPEPSSTALLGLGGLALILRRRK